MYSVASCDAEIRSGQPGPMGPAETHGVWNFLLACAASPFTSEHRYALRASARNGLEWEAALSLAQVQGLLPLLHERLAEIGDLVPDVIRRAVTRAFEQNARQTLWLTQVLFDVNDLFQRHGIEALPYKGAVLAQLLYGNVALRQYSDVDVMVRAADVHRARAVLQDSGFISALYLSVREEQAYIATGYEYTFHAGRYTNVLELQWRVLPHFYAIDFDVAGFFRRSQKIRICERTLATLGNEDLLLVLCAHAAKHGWAKLSWTREVAELAQSRKIHWDRVMEPCRSLGIRRIVAATFCIASKLLGTPVPAAVLPLILHDDALGQIAREVSRGIESGQEHDVESLAYFRSMAQLRERRRDRLQFWWRLATVPSLGEWSLVGLPGILFPLYRGIRVARLGARLIRSR